MKTRRLLPLAAAAAFGLTSPAVAQHDKMHSEKNPHGDIAEGTVKGGVRTVEMAVTEDGFVPAKIKAKKGEKLRLVITRKTDRTCATEIVVKDYGIEKELPLDKPVTVELTPTKSGEIGYACGMGHVTGVLLIP
jgi:plastocyanin domain-containing protein